MNILIVYATNSGSTYLAAEHIAHILEKRSHLVTIQKAGDTAPADLKEYEVVLFGTPSWSVEGHEGYPLPTILTLVRALTVPDITKKQLAFFGCGDRSYTYFCGAVDFLEKWAVEILANVCVPSLRIDGYFFDLVQNEAVVDDWAGELAKRLEN